LIERLSPSRAFPRVLANTAGHYPFEPARLTRQLEFASRLVRDVPVSALSYARKTDEMLHVRDAVLADMEEANPPVDRPLRGLAALVFFRWPGGGAAVD
jgi:hypothetical protein